MRGRLRESPRAEMRVVMVSDVETQGGAAIAASRLAKALCQLGHQVTRLAAAPDGARHEWATRELALSYPLPPFHRLLWRALTVEGRERLGNRLARRRLDGLLAELRPDVINVHNLHFTFHPRWSPDLLRVCAAHAPTVWTLHDMWSFTGRCVYNYGCERFLRGCDAACPTAADYPSASPGTIARAWEERRRLFEALPGLTAVTPSRWLAREAQRGLWAGHRVEVIPYGLELDVYRPLDRALARRELGLDAAERLLLFAAQNLADPRKGWPLLERALRLESRHGSRRGVRLLALGGGDLPARVNGVEIKRLDYITDERAKALVYNAADLLVHPAPLDNSPLVVAEALACGTPAAAFAVGGAPEMVVPGCTGWLATETSAAALAETLDAALADLSRGGDLRNSCREFAETRFGFAEQARRYLRLFSSLLYSSSTCAGESARETVATR